MICLHPTQTSPQLSINVVYRLNNMATYTDHTIFGRVDQWHHNRTSHSNQPDMGWFNQFVYTYIFWCVHGSFSQYLYCQNQFYNYGINIQPLIRKIITPVYNYRVSFLGSGAMYNCGSYTQNPQQNTMTRIWSIVFVQ